MREGWHELSSHTTCALGMERPIESCLESRESICPLNPESIQPSAVSDKSTTLCPVRNCSWCGAFIERRNGTRGKTVIFGSAVSPDSTVQTKVFRLSRRATLDENERAMQYSLPVILDYDGRKRLATMGPFERSIEREFSLAVNKKAIEECTDLQQLKEVATNLLIGWSNMQGAVNGLIKENMNLRHAIGLRDADLQAAEELMNQAASLIEKQAVDRANKLSRSSRSKWRLWPW